MRTLRKNIICSKNPWDNILEHNNVFYRIEKLTEDVDKNEGGKGGNSSVFKLFDPNEEMYYVIKFCKYNLNLLSKNDWIKQRIYRFENEITALENAKNIGLDNIIEILFSGEMKIGSGKYRYYVMEKGEKDLTDYLAENELTIQQKILLCDQVLKGVKQLHDELRVYHRDIKPDNIFFVGDIWKIGDLGLIDFRDEDQNIDDLREKIGPYGWLSPEVTNKLLCEGTQLEKKFPCKIDTTSDIFQLGKLFWYIFQGNIPIGQISNEDFKTDDNTIFLIIKLMLQYSKDRRPSMEEIENEFKKVYSRYGI